MTIELPEMRISLVDRLRAEWVLSHLVPAGLVVLYVLPMFGAGVLAMFAFGVLPDALEPWWFLGVAALATPVGATCGIALGYMLNPLARKPFRYTIDGAGVHVISDLFSFSHPWPAILHTHHSRGFMLLFFSKRCAHCLPMSIIEGAGQLPALLEILRANGKTVRHQ